MMRWLKRSDCDRASGMLSEYLDGYLAPQDKAWLEGHIAGCVRCQDELASLRGTVSLLQGLPHAEPRRSFLIGPRPIPLPVPVPVRGWGALRLATAMATVLLVAVVTADALGITVLRPSTVLAPAATTSTAMTAPSFQPAVAQGDLKAPVGLPGPAGAAGPPVPTTGLTEEVKAAGPAGPPGPGAPAATAEGRATFRAVPAQEPKPTPAQKFQYADTSTAAGAGITPTPAPAPQPTPPPAPTPAPRLEAAGPTPQMAEDLQYARGNATPAPLARETLLERTWPLQAGLVAVWVVLVALTSYFWRIRSKGARSIQR